MQDWKLGDLNKSKAYISPILGLNRDGTVNKFKFSDFYDNTSSLGASNFINCFLGDDAHNIENKVLMLYKFSGKEAFIEFESNISKHPLFVDQYDPDKLYVMYVFDIPEKVQNDYNLIKEGKYSQVSEFYKQHILKFLNHDKISDSRVRDVLYKNEKAFERSEKLYGIKIPRDQEAQNKPVRREEYYQEEYKIKEALVAEGNR